jgi:CRISPR-associated endonuclease Csn1
MANRKRLLYRLALDIGSTSIGWALFRLTPTGASDYRWRPTAIIRAGVRIFRDGREPAAPGQVGTSLAAVRREKRAARRRRDRLLRRKARMRDKLVEHGFFPLDKAARKALERLNPYQLRAKGLDQALTPGEFARALFHINQRRGFKSNRKTDKKGNDSSALKQAINTLHGQLDPSGTGGKARTVGELLWKRMQEGLEVRSKNKSLKPNKVQYDLYIDRAMIEDEFDALWAKQANLNPTIFTEAAYLELKDCLLYQRRLKPVDPGRCTLESDEERAPLALPSQQRFRIYQEVNNLRILHDDSSDNSLTWEQCAQIAAMLERPPRDKKTTHEITFDQIRTSLNLGGNTKFTLEDDKRKSLKGNTTSAILARREHFGPAWFTWSERQQDAIVLQLISQENRDHLIKRLMKYCLVDEAHAAKIADAELIDGYGRLSRKALARILPYLKHPDEQGHPRTYDKAVQAAGYEHHSHISHAATGEILPELPYYGEYLQRHVGFGTGDPKDAPEKRYGKISNPTVHIGLNQVRVVVNALIKCYGHPGEIIVEVANELKRPADHRKQEFRFGKITKETMRRYCSCAGCVNVRQAINQELNKELRAIAAKILGRNPRSYDMEKMRLWNEAQELNGGIVTCPYSGETLGVKTILSNAVEIDHILPHSITLDDGLANKVLCVKAANQIKKERSPIAAKDDFLRLGWNYEDILARVKNWPEQKRYRFGADAMERWKGRADTFLARSLNDTRYLSRIAVEYLSLICPQGTRSIPGQMTAKLREELGLDGSKEKSTPSVLGLVGKKNRNDHRHHAVDACVIGITDQGMLKKFSDASASARKKDLEKLIDTLEPPWPTYHKHVQRAVDAIFVSHRPDHGFEGSIFKDTAFGIRKDGTIIQKPTPEGKKERIVEYVVPLRSGAKSERQGMAPDGRPYPYKGYVPDGNYCLEIIKNESTQWLMNVTPTFRAYEIARKFGWGKKGIDQKMIARKVYESKLSDIDGDLVIKLTKGDLIRLNYKGKDRILLVVKMSVEGGATFTELNEANTSDRYEKRRKARLKVKANEKAENEGRLIEQLSDAEKGALEDVFFLSQIGVADLQSGKARRVTISPIGELRDPGFKE